MIFHTKNLEKSKDSALTVIRSIETKKLDLQFQINSAWKKICAREAEKTLRRSMRFGSVARIPATVLTNTGKKQIKATIIILDVIPKPNHIMISGAIATFGID